VKIDIGCGQNKREGFIGIDVALGPQVDYVLDIERDQLPFEDNSVDYVFSNHTFEHITSPQNILREIVRVCRHNALVEIWTPYLKSNDAFLLGHFSFYNESIWKHICYEYDGFYFGDALGRFELQKYHYVLFPNILDTLSQMHIPFQFALEHMFNIALEFGVFIRVDKTVREARKPQIPAIYASTRGRAAPQRMDEVEATAQRLVASPPFRSLPSSISVKREIDEVELPSEQHYLNTKEQVTEPPSIGVVIDAFHELYYNGPRGEQEIYKNTTWMGVPCEKCPLDMWIYQEILHEVRPDLIIETGTRHGGSALFLAHMLDLLGKGRIVTIDVEALPRPHHPRITYITGSSDDPDVVAGALPTAADVVCLVILDSDHSKQHVLRELELLAPVVSVGSYLIVEDTNINGHPTFPEFGPGPYEAVEEFLQNNNNFIVDDAREKFLMTFNPRGFLKRI
jgi:cephalosporin hydroxylase